MPRALKLYIVGLVTLSAAALAITSFVYAQLPGFILGMRPEISAIRPPTPQGVVAGLCYWVVLTLFASALPVRMQRGAVIAVSTAPLAAVMILGGPVAAGWAALIGTTEVRELRGRVPWYGSLSNHAGIVLPAIAGGVLAEAIRGVSNEPAVLLLATICATAVLYGLNVALTSVAIALREGVSLPVLLTSHIKASKADLTLGPLAWLMTVAYGLPSPTGLWAPLLFALPLYTTRVGYQRLGEMREMFTQTIEALAGAVDKRDPFTSKHSQRVKDIAKDIGVVMRLNEAEMEAVEWGGLLHDVGKIGVPDHVLLKADRLTREERAVMNSHPVLGAQIIAPVTRLAAELPIIRHHHEWYNGSGYPDRLIGEEIPRLARVLHVADAFEAMTAPRPYRMVPLSIDQALAELRKFAGIQFDPEVVDAFHRTHWAEGARDPNRGEDGSAPVRLHPLPPLIGDHGSAAARGSRPADAH